MSVKNDVLESLKGMSQDQILRLLSELGGDTKCSIETMHNSVSRGTLRHGVPMNYGLHGEVRLAELEVVVAGRVRLQTMVAALLGAKVWLGEISEERIISIIEKVKK